MMANSAADIVKVPTVNPAAVAAKEAPAVKGAAIIPPAIAAAEATFATFFFFCLDLAFSRISSASEPTMIIRLSLRLVLAQDLVCY